LLAIILSSELSAESNDNLTFQSDTEIKDCEILLEGNLTVTNQSKLSLINVTLIVNSTDESDISLSSTEGTFLYLENATVRSINSSTTYDTNFLGSLMMLNSEMQNLGGNLTSGGLKIFNKLDMINSKISNSYHFGIYCRDAVINIENSSIENILCTDKWTPFTNNIVGYNSIINVSNSYISNSSFGIFITNTNFTISSSTILNTSIYIKHDSNVNVNNNLFLDCDDSMQGGITVQGDRSIIQINENDFYRSGISFGTTGKDSIANISRNSIVNSTYGIIPSNYCEIRGNAFIDNNYGIFMRTGTTENISNNTFKDNYWDIGIGNGMDISSDNILQNNIFVLSQRNIGSWDQGWSYLSSQISISDRSGLPLAGVSAALTTIQNDMVMHGTSSSFGTFRMLEINPTPYYSVVILPIRRIFHNSTIVDYLDYKMSFSYTDLIKTVPISIVNHPNETSSKLFIVRHSLQKIQGHIILDFPDLSVMGVEWIRSNDNDHSTINFSISIGNTGFSDSSNCSGKLRYGNQDYYFEINSLYANFNMSVFVIVNNNIEYTAFVIVLDVNDTIQEYNGGKNVFTGVIEQTSRNKDEGSWIAQNRFFLLLSTIIVIFIPLTHFIKGRNRPSKE